MSNAIAAIGGRREAETLLAFACEALGHFYDEATGGFHFKLSAKGDDRLPEPRTAVSQYSTPDRYFLITAVGVGAYRQRRGSIDLAFDFDAAWVLHRERARAFTDAGDLGLAVWAAALLDDGAAPELADHLATRCEGNLDNEMTQDVAWALQGLLATSRKDAAARLASVLRGRLGRGGFFRPSGEPYPFATFNHQVYGLAALAAWAASVEDEEALSEAAAVARRLIAAQGPKGHWWWLYDADKGVVSDRYPAYAVHQTAMGPMMLRAAHEHCGVDLEPALGQSLAWTFGENEVGESLLDADACLIWRAIRRNWKGGRKRWFQAMARRGMGWVNRLTPGFQVNRESRAYHYGWILYALS